MQEYLIAVRNLCSQLTSMRLQQFTVGNVQRLQEFLACQEVKHEQTAAQLDTFGDMAVGAVTAACHAALEHLEAHLSKLHPDQVHATLVLQWTRPLLHVHAAIHLYSSAHALRSFSSKHLLSLLLCLICPPSVPVVAQSCAR